ncbi:hypothetical protein CPB86DRAFT_810354 [Serendipita vermifera]|nr:hypothetical protein CPB86DRAFT_810354 [Serendipita vermifera]
MSPVTRRTRHGTPSPTRSASPEGTHAPRTHHSDRSPILVRVPDEEDFTPTSRPATRRGEALSTIHEGDSVRTGSPSVIQLPPSRTQHRSTLRVASPGTHPSIAPSVIQLPSGEIARRATPQMLRVTTPRAETPVLPPPAQIIRVPSAPPTTPQGRILRIGTPRMRAPSPESRPATVQPTVQPTVIHLPSERPQPTRSQTVRVGGTPVPTPIAQPQEPAPTTPNIIHLPAHAHEPQRSQTIRVGAPTPTPRPETAVPGFAPTIVQLPGYGPSLGPQTVRVASPEPPAPAFPEATVIRLHEHDDRRPGRSQTVRVGSPTGAPAPPTVIHLPDHGERSPIERSQTVRVGSPSGAPAPATVIRLPEHEGRPAMERSQTIRVGSPTGVPLGQSIIRLPEQERRAPERSQTIRVGTPGGIPGGPSVIRLPEHERRPERSQTIRVGTPSGLPTHAPATVIRLPEHEERPTVERSQTIRVGSPTGVPVGPSIIRIPDQEGRAPERSQTIRVGTPAGVPVGPSIIRLPEQETRPGMERSQTIRVGTPAAAPLPPSVIRLPEHEARPHVERSQTIRVGSPPVVPMPPSVIRLPEQGHVPERSHIRVGSPTVVPVSPSVIQLPGERDVPQRVPTSQLVRVGGAPITPAHVPPSEQIIRLPGAPTPQPQGPPAFIRVGADRREPVRSPSPPQLPPPTMIQLPGTAAGKPSTIRVAAPSVSSPTPVPTSHLIRLPSAPTTPAPAFVRVPEGMADRLTTVPGVVGTPGVVRVEKPDRTPTVIQVASPGPGSRYVRATPSPSAAVPGFVRARGTAVSPALSRVPEIVRVGEHTPVPGASRTSLDRPLSDIYPEHPHRSVSIASVGRDDIFAPVASRSSMAGGRSIADNLDEIARQAEEEAEQRRRRRGVGLPSDAFAMLEDRESRRERQLEEFLEQQRLENQRLIETLTHLAPGRRRSGASVRDAEAAGQIGDLVAEAVDTIKGHRSERASIISIRDDELRRDLEHERNRVQELEAELARMRELLEAERAGKEVSVQDKCAEMHEAVTNNHNEIRAHLNEVNESMMQCKAEMARRAEMEDQKMAEKEVRRAAKDDQQSQIHQMLATMMAAQEEERRIREEERRKAAEEPNLQAVIEQLRQQNVEQQGLLVTLLNEYRDQSALHNNATVEAVRAAVAQHVPMDIKAHLNEFSKSLAEEVRLLLREVGKLREEKRNIQYEIGCMLCLKSKYGPGGEFDPEWKPTTGPLTGGPPMPEQPGPEAPQPLQEDRPATAPPAWRTIHQKKKAKKREQPQPAPASTAAPPVTALPSAPSIPMHMPPMSMSHPVSNLAPPTVVPAPSVMGSIMDPARQASSWYAWTPDPQYAPSSPSSAPLYEVPESRPLGFFGPRSPRESGF